MSEKESNSCFDDEKKVYSLEEIKEDLCDKTIIVAMAENAALEVCEKLSVIPSQAVWQMNKEEFQYNDRDISILEKNNNKNIEDNYFSSRCLVPRVSVIVPVYNVEQYLTQCLDSILKQTLKDIEIICVDDGSTDHSSEILDDYKNRDPRIKVIHKDNKGYGHTINTGVSAANGEYVGIVESDDSIMVDMYEKLYYQAVTNNLDLVKGEFYYCWDEIGYRTPMHMDKMKDYYYRVLTDEDSDMFWEFPMNTWSGIYRRDFLLENDIYHHESPGASFQDNGFWVQTVCHAKRAMWISDQLYLYRQDNENASVRGDKKLLLLLMNMSGLRINSKSRE